MKRVLVVLTLYSVMVAEVLAGTFTATSSQSSHIDVIEDTYVDDWAFQPDPDYESHDKDRDLLATVSDTPPTSRRIFIRFDVRSDSIENVEGAIARLYMHTELCPPDGSQGAAPYATFAVLEDWTASNLDGRFIPKTDWLALSQIWPQESSGSWVDWDITPLFQRWLKGEPNRGVSIMVNDAQQIHSYCSFYSSESEFPPRLVIERPLPPLVPMFLPFVSAAAVRSITTVITVSQNSDRMNRNR